VKDTARFRRTAVAACLVIGPALAVVSNVLQPPFVSDHADRLADLAAGGAASWLSLVAFTAMQAPMLVAYLGIAHLLRTRSPRLANVTSVVAVLAAFGEAVMGGMSMVYLSMAPDVENREVYAALWADVESSPVMMFAMVGFLGTVLTVLLLSIGLFRTRVAPRWVPALLWAFLVLEFGGSNVSEFATYAAVLCLLVAYATLAGIVRRSPREEWDAAVAATAAPDTAAVPA
jgi:hypothetical protein